MLEYDYINIIKHISYGLTETTAGCVYQRVGVSPAGSTGMLISNMECKLVDEEGNGKISISAAI